MKQTSLSLMAAMAIFAAGATLRAFAGEHPATSSVPQHWAMQRFLDKQKEVAALKGQTVDLVMLGDSITHFWESRHLKHWKEFSEAGNRTALNLGYSADRTYNLIWRIENGELDGYTAKVVAIMIGTNNNSSKSADPAKTAEGVEKVVALVREKQPQAKIILHAIFPRGESPASRHAGARERNDATNALLKEWAEKDGNVVWLDLTEKLTDETGWVPKDIMGDGIHPAATGYAIWAEALAPYLANRE